MLLLLAGCVAGPTPPVSTADTSLLDTGATPVRPIEWRGGSEFGQLGSALAWIPLDPPLLAISTPLGGDGGWDDRVDLVTPLTQPDDANAIGPIAFHHDVPEDLSSFGATILAPGDVTGNGANDFVVFDTRGYDDDVYDTDTATSAAYLFEGPLDRQASYASPDDALRIFGDPPWRGAPCGDLDGDGDPELCTAIGIAAGPVAGPVTFDITWSAAVPAEEIRLLTADLTGTGIDLIVSDPATARIHRLTSLPAPGDHDLASLAASTWTAVSPAHVLASGGDLDGDGLHDLVVATGASVAIATGLDGDLAAAHATLDLLVSDLALGDFDGDGADDLAAGTPEGAVYLFLGPLPAGPLDLDDADNVLVGHHPDDAFGHALVAADADGDGDAELMVGAPKAPHTQDNGAPGGRAYLFHDPATFSWDDFDPPLEPIYPD